MRGIFRDQGQLFSYVSPESRVPPGHPLRKIRGLVRDVLKELSRSFARLYANDGRPSVPPEQLLSALLIQALYGIRSERQLMAAEPQPAVSLVRRPVAGRCGVGCNDVHQEPRAAAGG
jgi:Transposase domain (DUF772)